ncbi:T9SS type A sorting domain-containing protein [Chryseobacterium sp. L7]|uniref:T9SS type A sorting domain-containing protein n=1 Tax=Chryseobacterium endalhagicum TaxID=2797638 RepID=A0ABS1QGA4_9FLAO|nr:T9SS type A sorting domain-containing protein [Chryseobacterium endalhagicum]MBL1221336.1 T9SS type A sorting domain-containing protein [Chryseobacterium endalhagicum]
MKHFYKFFFGNEKKKYLKAAFSFVLLAAATTVEAQVSAYSFTQSAGTYSPISGTVLGVATGNASATNLNSNVYPVTMPFDFVFNGTAYNALNVSSNGFITFGATTPGTTTTTPISSTTAYDGAVSVFGRDISSVFDIAGTTGDIMWETSGTAPNRETVIQWRNFRPNSSTSTTAAYTFSFQIRLQETSNVIQMVYSNGAYLVGSASISGTAQIGLRGAAATDFNTRLNATTLEFVNSTPGTANSSTQAFNTVNSVPGMPTAGLTYIWTPPTCYAPSGLTGGTTTNNSSNVSWTASPSSPSGYDIYYSTTNTAPTSSTPPTNPNVPGTSASIGPLAPSTLYYVWIRSNCGGGNTSIWSLQPVQVVTQCLPPAILTTSGATVCPGQSATLTATADAGASIKWYDASTAGNVVGTGASFATPALSNTTQYYVAASTGSSSATGLTNAISTSGYTLDAGLLFDVYSTTTINGVYVYPMGTGAGTVEIALQDGNVSPAVTLQTITVNLTGSPAPYVKTYVPLNFTVQPGTKYKLMMLTRAGGVSSLVRESGSSWGSYPFTVPGVMSITDGNLTANSPSTSYYYFYDWQITSSCESVRTTVTATVDSACLSTSEVNRKEQMKVYPNPFKDIITITDIEKVKSIQVFDSAGRNIRTLDHLSREIDLGDLKSGLYILHLTMKDGSATHIKAIKK